MIGFQIVHWFSKIAILYGEKIQSSHLSKILQFQNSLFATFYAMKTSISDLVRKIAEYLPPMQKWIVLSLAFWVSHIILRVLLLFRENPYGFPFVSKPDWYIFHAVCIDFLWISKSLVS